MKQKPREKRHETKAYMSGREKRHETKAKYVGKNGMKQKPNMKGKTA